MTLNQQTSIEEGLKLMALKYSHVVSVDEVSNARRSSLRESFALNTQRLLKTTAPKPSVNSVAKHKSVLICVNQCLNIICENLWLNFILYLKKQTQFFPVSSPKTTIPPIQTQFKANSNPIQTQFFTLKMNNLVYPVIFSKNTVLICVNQCLKIIRVNSWIKTIPFYAKRTQTSLFPAQKQRFGEKTNPKRTQTKPNGFDAKMNLYPVIIKRYEKIR